MMRVGRNGLDGWSDMFRFKQTKQPPDGGCPGTGADGPRPYEKPAPQPAAGPLARWLCGRMEAELRRPYAQLRSRRVDFYVSVLCRLERVPSPGMDRRAALAMAGRICGDTPAAQSDVWPRLRPRLVRAACVFVLAGGLLCRLHCIPVGAAKQPAGTPAHPAVHAAGCRAEFLPRWACLPH